MHSRRVTLWTALLASAATMVGCGDNPNPPQAAAVTAQELAARAKDAAGDQPLPCCPAPAPGSNPGPAAAPGNHPVPGSDLVSGQVLASKTPPGAGDPVVEDPVGAGKGTALPEGTNARAAEGSAPPDTPPARSEAAAAVAGVSDQGSGVSGASRRGDWIAPDQRSPFHLDYTLTDQEGQTVSLASFRGKPAAITFFFTTCPLPQMCPLIVTTTARLQEQLEAAGLDEQVQLLLISYDPKRDTPAAMKRYGQDRGLSFTNARMLVPSGQDLRDLIHEFQIGVQYHADGSIGHFIELILMDRQGRFVRDYTGSIWSNDQVVEDLRQLAAEP